MSPPPKLAMIMGVVCRPIESKNFDGRIHLERVSKTIEVRKLTGHQKFWDDVRVNQQIKEGSWKDLHVPGMSLDEIKFTLQEEYGLDEAVADRIDFVYKTKVLETPKPEMYLLLVQKKDLPMNLNSTKLKQNTREES